MEEIKIFISILLPSAAVMFGMYLTVKAFLQKEFEKRSFDLKVKNNDIILPNRLQAYERMCLLLERISPSNLLMRVNAPEHNVASLQRALLNDVREEFNHNLAQQVYMSDKAWEHVKKAKEDVISMINKSAQVLDPELSGKVLAKEILNQVFQKELDPIALPITFVKNEIRQLY